MTERKIAIVGTASSGKAAPYHDPSWEIWGVSARADYVTRANRWFELHRLSGEPEAWADKWRETIKGFGADIPEFYMMFPESDLHHNVVRYPYDKIVDRFGTRFMTSTFSWMMAMAIDELRPVDGEPVPARIGIFGADMEYGTEYRQQRAGFFHFIWLAHFAGIAVDRLADGGFAYDPVPYPFWQDDPLLAKNALRRKQALDQLNEWDDHLQRTKRMGVENIAVMRELDRITKEKGYGHVRAYVENRREALERELEGLDRTRTQLENDLASKRGQYEEQCWLDDYLQP